MVYFWQKQSRRNRHSSPKTAISPLLSAATTAAETVLAAVVSGKSDKRSPSIEPASEIRASPESISTSHSAIDEAVHIYRGSDDGGRRESGSDVRVRGSGDGGDEGGGGGGEPSDGGSNPNMRTRLASSSSSCRGNSSVMTTKIQSLVLDKLSEYARRKQESNRRRVAERELDSLNLKIDKLLSKMDDGDSPGQGKMRLDEECVVCLAAPATMKTFPCAHRVVCRKCLIKTMQVAVSQRCLPLRCVICRNRILSLQHSQDADRSGAICLPDDSNNNNNNNNINKYHSNYTSTATTTNNNNNNFGKAIHGHHNSCYTNHNNSNGGKIMRSNTTPTIQHSSSTPFKVSISSPSSPVSQQQAFVPVGPSHAHHFSSYYNAPSTSHGVPSNGGMFHRYHCVYPVQVHAAPLHVSHHASSSTPQKKSSSKCVNRLLGTR